MAPTVEGIEGGRSSTVMRLIRETSGEQLIGYALMAGVVTLFLRPGLAGTALHQVSYLVDIVADAFNTLS